MRDAAVRTIQEFALKDKDVIMMSGDLGFGVLDIFRHELPRQYFNAGICEQSMSSVAAGLALEGKKVYTYSIGNFPTIRCLEQIRNDICYHNANVTILAVGGGFAYGSLGMSHHATEDLAILRSLPNMRVFAPADAIETEVIVRKMYNLQAPCYIRLNKGGEESIHQSIDELSDYKPGDAICIRDGRDACIMAAGAIASEAVKAANLLEAQNIHASVYSFPGIKPIDKETILNCAGAYEAIYTVEEHNVVGGFGSAVAETVTEGGKPVRVVRIGLEDVYSSIVGSQAYLRHVYGMDGESIANRIVSDIKKR